MRIEIILFFTTKSEQTVFYRSGRIVYWLFRLQIKSFSSWKPIRVHFYKLWTWRIREYSKKYQSIRYKQWQKPNTFFRPRRRRGGNGNAWLSVRFYQLETRGGYGNGNSSTTWFSLYGSSFVSRKRRGVKSTLKNQQEAEDQDLGILLAVQEFSLFQRPIGWLLSFKCDHKALLDLDFLIFCTFDVCLHLLSILFYVLKI